MASKPDGTLDFGAGLPAMGSPVRGYPKVPGSPAKKPRRTLIVCPSLPDPCADSPELTPQQKELLDVVETFYHITIDRHTKFVALLNTYFHENVIFDSPAVAVRGRDRLKALLLGAKGLFDFHFRPLVVVVNPQGAGGSGSMEVAGILNMRPRPSWVFPLARLLPRIFPFRFTVTIGYWVHNGQIHSIKERVNNLPPLPWILRYAAGMQWGMLGAITLPLWLGPFRALVGSPIV